MALKPRRWPAKMEPLGVKTVGPSPPRRLVVGGPDVKAKVVTWNAPTTPSQVNVPGVGFAPEVVLHLGGGSGYTAPPPSSDVAAILLLGAMDARGGQWTVSPNAINGQKPSDTQRVQSSSSCLQAIDATLTVHKDARFAGMTSDGFALDFITASGSASQMVSLAIGGVSARVGSFTKSPAAAPARQPVAGHGFRPGLLMMASWQAPAGASGPHSRFGLGKRRPAFWGDCIHGRERRKSVLGSQRRAKRRGFSQGRRCTRNGPGHRPSREL